MEGMNQSTVRRIARQNPTRASTSQNAKKASDELPAVQWLKSTTLD